MPKIIKNLKEKIFHVSTKLFLEHGYEKVDMKIIAKNCNIAVGTLYNYYKNKKELYISIVEDSWDKTFLKLTNLLDLDISQKDKMYKTITTLYEDMEQRRGIGKEILNNNICDEPNDTRIKDFNTKLLSNMENLIHPLSKTTSLENDQYIDTKIAEILLVTIVVLIEAHPNAKDDNIKFLNTMINSFIK